MEIQILQAISYKIRTALYVLLSGTWHWNFKQLLLTTRPNCGLLEIVKKYKILSY